MRVRKTISTELDRFRGMKLTKDWHDNVTHLLALLAIWAVILLRTECTAHVPAVTTGAGFDVPPRSQVSDGNLLPFPDSHTLDTSTGIQSF